VLVSSAEETAKDVYGTLVVAELETSADARPEHEFLCTGDPARFEAVARRFVASEAPRISAARLELAGGRRWS
jgi:glutamate racemase